MRLPAESYDTKWHVRGDGALVRDIWKFKCLLYYIVLPRKLFQIQRRPRPLYCQSSIALVANLKHTSATSRAEGTGGSQEYASSFGIEPRNSAPENRDAPSSEQARLHHNCRTRFRFRYDSVGDSCYNLGAL